MTLIYRHILFSIVNWGLNPSLKLYISTSCVFTQILPEDDLRGPKHVVPNKRGINTGT
jgi:hypothetical protein